MLSPSSDVVSVGASCRRPLGPARLRFGASSWAPCMGRDVGESDVLSAVLASSREAYDDAVWLCRRPLGWAGTWSWADALPVGGDIVSIVDVAFAGYMGRKTPKTDQFGSIKRNNFPGCPKLDVTQL